MQKPLLPTDTDAAPAPLSAEQQARAANHREAARRKFKMARLLHEGGLPEEARTPLIEGAHAVSRALAIEARLPEPAALDEALLPPLSRAWKEALAPLRAFVSDANQPAQPLLDRLATA